MWSAQLSLDFPPPFQQEIDLRGNLAGQPEVGGEALHTARPGVQAQQVESDRLERLHRVGQAGVNEIALGLEGCHDAIVAGAPGGVTPPLSPPPPPSPGLIPHPPALPPPLPGPLPASHPPGALAPPFARLPRAPLLHLLPPPPAPPPR